MPIINRSMTQKEHFYTSNQFSSAGIEPFIGHAKQYLEGQRTTPVSKAPSIHQRDICFTFSDPLLEQLLRQPDSLSKPYEVALKFGFRGYSSGKSNGILLLRKQDSGLISAVDRLTVRDEEPIRENLSLEEGGLDALRKVKIVWHQPFGERIVGVYNTRKDRMHFLDFARY